MHLSIHYIRIALGLLAGLAAVLSALPASGYDMDCKVILCLAGGFPAGCSDARAYMLSRLRSIPPKSPFGHCAGTDSRGLRVFQGREPVLPCASGFRMRDAPGNSDAGCCCTCGATSRTAYVAYQLASNANEVDGRTFPPATVLPPSREDDREFYVVKYECRRRPRPNWLRIGIRTHLGDWSVSDRYWWR